jgi:hypothetical protein
LRGKWPVKERGKQHPGDRAMMESG